MLGTGSERSAAAASADGNSLDGGDGDKHRIPETIAGVGPLASSRSESAATPSVMHASSESQWRTSGERPSRSHAEANDRGYRRRWRMLTRSLCGPTVVIDCGLPSKSGVAEDSVSTAVNPDAAGSEACVRPPSAKRPRLEPSGASGARQPTAKARPSSHSSDPKVPSDPLPNLQQFEWEAMMTPAEQRSLSAQIARSIQACMRAAVPCRIIVCGLSSAAKDRLHRRRGGQMWPAMLTSDTLEQVLERSGLATSTIGARVSPAPLECSASVETGSVPKAVGEYRWQPCMPLPKTHPAALLRQQREASLARESSAPERAELPSIASSSGMADALTQSAPPPSSAGASPQGAPADLESGEMHGCRGLRLEEVDKYLGEFSLDLDENEAKVLQLGSQRPWPPLVGCCRVPRGRDGASSSATDFAWGPCGLCGGRARAVYLAAEGSAKLDLAPPALALHAAPAGTAAPAGCAGSGGPRPLGFTYTASSSRSGAAGEPDSSDSSGTDSVAQVGACDIVVVGGLVDRNRFPGVALARAQALGLQAARLQLPGHDTACGAGGDSSPGPSASGAGADKAPAGSAGGPAEGALQKRRPLTTVHVVQLMLNRLAGDSWDEAAAKVLPTRGK